MSRRTSQERPTLPRIRDLFPELDVQRSPRLSTQDAPPTAALSRMSLQERHGTVSSSPSFRNNPTVDSPPAYPKALPFPYPHSRPHPHHPRSAQPLPSRDARDRLNSSPQPSQRPPSSIESHQQHYRAPEPVERRATYPSGYSPWHTNKRHSIDATAQSPLPSASASASASASGSNSPRSIGLPDAIVTDVRTAGDDEDPTPVARQRPHSFISGGQQQPLALRPPPPQHHEVVHIPESTGMDGLSSTSVFKYECTYCGKGFSRPSSLKIHLNSHTGEKPFTCTIEGCGRTFSVLSNMRRHARVHQTGAEDGAEPSSLRASSSRRRDSIVSNASASTASSSSRRSRSRSLDKTSDAPPGKRPRQ